MLKRTIIAIVCAIALPAWGKELAVKAIDRELDIPLEGVSLEISGTQAKAVTDESGSATLTLPDGFERGVLTAQCPGYQSLRLTIVGTQREVSLRLLIADVIEGKELVVERAAPEKSDAKSGVSLTMDNREMKTTAQIGLIEDVMASVSTLPGVGYTGNWSSQPSIRGGYPDEMGTVLDGVYVVSPWHWGGAYSIFDPLMVDTVKMSHGIFSARYGRAMSGLLEVTTIKPSSSLVRIDGGIGTTSCNLFAQVPFGDKAGLFIGGKLTYLEPLGWFYDAMGNEPKMSETIPTMPYIRDFYAKLYYAPTPKLDLSLNLFFGSDGVGTSSEDENDGITTKSEFDWLNILGFVGLNARWMPTDRAVVHFIGAYNNNTMDLDLNVDPSGMYEYSDAFLDVYDNLDGSLDRRINGATGYSVDRFKTTGFARNVIHQAQGKLETDFLVTGSHVVSVGVEEVFQFAQAEQEFNTWIETVEGSVTTFRPVTYEMDVNGNRVLNSSAYLLWAFGSDSSPLRGEIGLRGEHFYLWNDELRLNTYPVANPRASAQWTPLRASKRLHHLTFSIGSGFYSMFPIDVIGAEDKYGVESFDVGPNRAWFQVVGAEVETASNWIFKLEGYYKRYFNRLYIVTDETGTETEYDAYTDGKGYAAGFDLMLQKKNGRIFDGYLSYSFVYAKYLNPTDPAYDNQETMSGEPLGDWYYPSFHRFHTLNLVLNIKPVTGMVITVKASLATGSPRTRDGVIGFYPATLDDGTVVERYTRTEIYDDSLRTDISMPIDIRFGYSNYFRNSRARWEFYVGAEDILVNLYSPKGNSDFDPFTGEEIADSDEADFNIGMPLISTGFKISY